MTAAALLIAACFGGGVWFYQMEGVDDAVTALAADETSFLARWDEGEFDDPMAAGARLRSALDARRGGDAGHFVFAEIYGPDHRPIAAAALEDAFGAEAAFDRVAHVFPVNGRVHYDKKIIDGKLHVRVVSAGRGRGFDGWFEGIFAVAPARLARINDAALTAALSIVAVVVATTLFLLPVVVGLNRHLVRLSESLSRANVEILEVLGVAVAKRDSDTGRHNYRVTLYAVHLAKALGVVHDDIRALIKGAFLHDVGKIAIGDAILLKPGRLTTDEFSVMKTHVDHGVDIIARSGWLGDATSVVAGHHEKFDGSGYPAGFREGEISLNARVFAVVDVFDALTSRRPYREPMSLERAVEILREERGTHFDPAVLDVFLGVAADLHRRFAGAGEEALRAALLSVTTRYFTAAE